MKNELLNKHIDACWSDQKFDQPLAIKVRDAAIHQGHLERAKAFIQFKLSIKRWLLGVFQLIFNRLSFKSGCSV